MDEFKKHLKLHEHGLNTEQPGDRVWEQIKSKTAKQKSRVFQMNNRMKYAAAAILVVMLAFAIRYITRSTKDPQPEVIVKKTGPVPVPQSDTSAAGPIAVVVQPDRSAGIKTLTKTVQASPKRQTTRSSVMDQLESSYDQLVNYRVKKIRSTPVYAENQDYFDSFKEQFRQIETDEAILKRDIARNGLNDLLLDQLIEVYQKKLNVLKSFQTAIQKMNNRVQFQGMDSTTSKHYYINL